MKLISIVTPSYNEEANVDEVYRQVKEVFKALPEYRYEHIFIDNASTDSTVEKIKRIGKDDKNVKLIVNAGNFGALKSPYYGLMQTKGDAVIMLVADLQDPPELIKTFIKKWEEGFKIVLGVKPKAEESAPMFAIRKIYYNIMTKISHRPHVKNFTSYALYDREFIEILRKIDETNPYLRGLITEFDLKRTEVEYVQPKRCRGKSAATLYILYDIAMLGFVNNSKVPLRMATFTGMIVAILSLIVSIAALITKLLFWNLFPYGTAALVTGLFFFGAVQLFFIGIIGEYVGAVFTEVKRRPLVIEKERMNFDD